MDKQLNKTLTNYFEKALHNRNGLNSFKKDVLDLNIKDLMLDKINQAADKFLQKMENQNNK